MGNIGVHLDGVPTEIKRSNIPLKDSAFSILKIPIHNIFAIKTSFPGVIRESRDFGLQQENILTEEIYFVYP